MNKKSNKIQTVKFDDFIVEHFKKNPKLAIDYLKFALEEYEKDGDERPLLGALKQVAIACGVLEI